MELKTIQPDPKMAADGVWVKYSEDEGGEFLIRPYGNREFERKMAKITGAKRKRMRSKEIPDEEYSDYMRLSMVGTILLDWRGFQFDGKDFPFTPEAAVKLLADFPDIRDFIQAESRDLTNFQEGAVNEHRETFPRVSDVASQEREAS